jgi:hypothetical protein
VLHKCNWVILSGRLGTGLSCQPDDIYQIIILLRQKRLGKDQPRIPNFVVNELYWYR